MVKRKSVKNQPIKVKVVRQKIVKTKQWYKSKTLWLGVLQLVGGVMLSLSQQLNAGTVLTLSGVLSLVLRVITKEQIKFK